MADRSEPLRVRHVARPLLFLALLATLLATAVRWGLPRLDRYVDRRRAMQALPADLVAGRYAAVRDVLPPFILRLEDGSLVKPAGVLALADLDDLAVARVRELLGESDGRVYVEPYASGDEGTDEPRPASIWLPPEPAAEDAWFPDEAMRLLAATMVREGFVRVDRNRPYVYREELLMQEHEARRHRRGTWASAHDRRLRRQRSARSASLRGVTTDAMLR